LCVTDEYIKKNVILKYYIDHRVQYETSLDRLISELGCPQSQNRCIVFNCDIFGLLHTCIVVSLYIMYADQSLHLMMSSKFFSTIQFNKRHANMSNNNIANNGVFMFMINDK